MTRTVSRAKKMRTWTRRPSYVASSSSVRQPGILPTSLATAGVAPTSSLPSRASAIEMSAPASCRRPLVSATGCA